MSDAARRLAQSRLAIVEQMQRREDYDPTDTRGAGRKHKPVRELHDGWFPALRHAAGTWWRHHPAHLALALAKPALAGYAQGKPLRFLGIAAALGALLAIARSWRLIPVTGLLLAMVKSSQLSDLLISALAAVDRRGEREHYE